MPRPADRFRTLPAYPLAHVPARKRELLAAGRDVIDLGPGDADLMPPPAAVEALRAALDARRPVLLDLITDPDAKPPISAFAGHYTEPF